MIKILCVLLFCIMNAIHAKPLDQYIQEAQLHSGAKEIDQAIAAMEQAVKEYPDSSIAYAKLGDYISETVKTYMDYFTVIPRAFAVWDTAVACDPGNLDARYSRGTWGVSVPQCLNQLEKGIGDLEYLVAHMEGTAEPGVQEKLLDAYSYLAEGYRKHWDFAKAKDCYARVTKMAPDTPNAKSAHNNIDNIVQFERWLHMQETRKAPDSPEIVELRAYTEAHPEDIDKLMILGNTYVEANKDGEAARIFEQVINTDSLNIKAYKMLAFALKRANTEGYDPRISMDHNYLADAVFKVLTVLDKAISIAPDDMELRLMRAQVGLMMFFFPGRRWQATEDLEMVIQSDAAETIKAAARYEIGRAHQKIRTTDWLRWSEYPEVFGADSIVNSLLSAEPLFDPAQYKKPYVVIDFVMTFRDELAPQTAVWIETKEGRFVKTIYVSGFTGYARAKGRLPQWQASSDFFDVDAVTGASIDMGHHAFVWELKNALGESVKAGAYAVKVEVTFWPSMQYQCIAAPITIGKKGNHIIVREGYLIPYLEVRYLP